MSRQVHEGDPGVAQEIAPITLKEAEKQIAEVVANRREFYDHDKRYEAGKKVRGIIHQFARKFILPRDVDEINIDKAYTGSGTYGSEYDYFTYRLKDNSIWVEHISPSAFCMGDGHSIVEKNRPEDWINHGAKIPAKLAAVAAGKKAV